MNRRGETPDTIRNMRSKIKLLVLFTCAHAILALGTFMYAGAAGMARFDNPEIPRAFGVSAAASIANVLMLPGLLVWTSSASKNVPNAVEWVLFIANSAMWGALGVIISARLSRHRYRQLRRGDAS